MSEQHYAKYIVYLSNLLQGLELPKEALDHDLKGEWAGCREFHVSGDLLVVYELSNDTLHLIRIGSHAQLFQ